MLRREGEKEHFGRFSGGEITQMSLKASMSVFAPLYSGRHVDRQRNRWTKGKRGMQGQAVEMSGFETEQTSSFKRCIWVSESITAQG